MREADRDSRPMPTAVAIAFLGHTIELMMMDRERTEQDDFSVGDALACWCLYTDKMVLRMFLGLQLSANLVVLIREQIIPSLSLSGVNEN
jgi:hypothetical protein